MRQYSDLWGISSVESAVKSRVIVLSCLATSLSMSPGVRTSTSLYYIETPISALSSDSLCSHPNSVILFLPIMTSKTSNSRFLSIFGYLRQLVSWKEKSLICRVRKRRPELFIEEECKILMS